MSCGASTRGHFESSKPGSAAGGGGPTGVGEGIGDAPGSKAEMRSFWVTLLVQFDLIQQSFVSVFKSQQPQVESAAQSEQHAAASATL
jgi:hypothetical protein